MKYDYMWVNMRDTLMHGFLTYTPVLVQLSEELPAPLGVGKLKQIKDIQSGIWVCSHKYSSRVSSIEPNL